MKGSRKNKEWLSINVLNKVVSSWFDVAVARAEAENLRPRARANLIEIRMNQKEMLVQAIKELRVLRGNSKKVEG